MNYIIITTTRPQRTIARHYIDRYSARDYVSPVRREYDGRITAPNALTFSDLQAARAYIGRNTDHPEAWQVVKYDACLNSIIQ